MQTIRLQVNSNIYKHIMWFLSRFKKDELQVIEEDQEFLSVQQYLQKELAAIEEGEAEFITIDELDKDLQATIDKQLKITTAFKTKLNYQVDFIAQDKPTAAQKFRDDILLHISRLINMPYSNRKSMFFNNENIRDLVFKGYVIVYKIDEQEEEIVVFGFYKYQQNPF